MKRLTLCIRLYSPGFRQASGRHRRRTSPCRNRTSARAANRNPHGLAADQRPRHDARFAKPLQWLDYGGTAALVAEAGYGGIDYAVRPDGHVLPEKVTDDLPRAVDAAKKAGLKVEMITTAIVERTTSIPSHCSAPRQSWELRFYRFGNFAYDEKLGVWGSLQKHRAAVKDLAALNQSLGLHGAFQNTPAPAWAVRFGTSLNWCGMSTRAGSGAI